MSWRGITWLFSPSLLTTAILAFQASLSKVPPPIPQYGCKLWLLLAPPWLHLIVTVQCLWLAALHRVPQGDMTPLGGGCCSGAVGTAVPRGSSFPYPDPDGFNGPSTIFGGTGGIKRMEGTEFCCNGHQGVGPTPYPPLTSSSAYVW